MQKWMNTVGFCLLLLSASISYAANWREITHRVENLESISDSEVIDLAQIFQKNIESLTFHPIQEVKSDFDSIKNENTTQLQHAVASLITYIEESQLFYDEPGLTYQVTKATQPFSPPVLFAPLSNQEQNRFQLAWDASVQLGIFFTGYHLTQLNSNDDWLKQALERTRLFSLGLTGIAASATTIERCTNAYFARCLPETIRWKGEYYWSARIAEFARVKMLSSTELGLSIPEFIFVPTIPMESQQVGELKRVMVTIAKRALMPNPFNFYILISRLTNLSLRVQRNHYLEQSRSDRYLEILQKIKTIPEENLKNFLKASQNLQTTTQMPYNSLFQQKLYFQSLREFAKAASPAF